MSSENKYLPIVTCPADALSLDQLCGQVATVGLQVPGLYWQLIIHNGLLYKYHLFLSTTIAIFNRFLLSILFNSFPFYLFLIFMQTLVSCFLWDTAATPSHLTRIMHVERRSHFTRARRGFRNLVNHYIVTRYENGTEIRQKYIEIAWLLLLYLVWILFPNTAL